MEPKDYIMISLLSILIIAVVVLIVVLLKKRESSSSVDVKEIIKSANDDQEKRIIDDNDRLKTDVLNIQTNTNKDLNEFKDKMTQSMQERFDAITKSLNESITKLTADMNKNVSDNFEKTNTTFSDIKQSIVKISEVQGNLKSVEDSIDSFKMMLENKKSRGNFGEFQLETLLVDAFGENSNAYSFQHTLSNGNIADVVLNLPDPLGIIVVDSKFPFDNFKKIHDHSLSLTERDQALKLFKGDVNKHIQDIASKYIIKGETAEQAMMFVPSEAVFAEIQGNCPECLDKAIKLKVWIASPTTLLFMVNTIQVTLKDIERSKSTQKILDELNKLSVEFDRFTERWGNLDSHINTLVKDQKDLTITTEKITKRFDEINNLSLEETKKEEE